ncbi:MAG: hypothetical protein NZM04_04205 [Methylacidiphilales bacterium]|nr:hypothetical protein [Candidatus Methylacidiphilales bacterium]MDW8349182.1 hypothetical protein [Verrucomicrobiae bacterium]
MLPSPSPHSKIFIKIKLKQTTPHPLSPNKSPTPPLHHPQTTPSTIRPTKTQSLLQSLKSLTYSPIANQITHPESCIHKQPFHTQPSMTKTQVPSPAATL